VNETAAAALAVDQTIRIRAPRERVFRLLTDLAELPRWMPVTAFEPRVGGRVEFVKGDMHAEGEVTEFEPPRAVAYTWDWRNQPLGARTEVRFELAEDGDGTLVHLTHRGFREEERRARHAVGWTHYAARLATVAEGGDPGPDLMGEADR
jgi:uncharacterized protein YndB with AHSA1/START domain